MFVHTIVQPEHKNVAQKGVFSRFIPNLNIFRSPTQQQSQQQQQQQSLSFVPEFVSDFSSSGYIDPEPTGANLSSPDKEPKSRLKAILPWNWVFLSPSISQEEV